MVDSAEEFPAVLARMETWMMKHYLGVDHTFAVVTDGYVYLFYHFYVYFLLYTSDTTCYAPPTMVTRCHVPHFHHYGDISIEMLRKESDENN